MTELDLGRTEDGQELKLSSDRLRTHGVIVGMTGSGKTGLGLVLLEELVQAGVPIIAIDPKGDLGNLGLLFPQFRPEDYAPWCGKDDPSEVASMWQKGLLRSGLTSANVSQLRERLRLRVYTPGSMSGIPINLLGMLKPPEPEILEDDETRSELVAGTISGLLGLTGRKADPIRDPAHVVLSQILDEAWQAGQQLDLAGLVLRLVDPPFEKVGVFPLDRFFPPDDRMDLAMAFNALIAAPSFSAWTQGQALDVGAMLQPSESTSGVHVFSLAHLDESQRQLFVSLLLSRTLAWSRRQPGRDDLRAVVYFDEVAGYLPPHPYNPPTKTPLLTMMKQARAVGLGVVLSTQNPVDVDYKALSNAGVWAIGRLNTEQDRKRLVKGLEAPGIDAQIAKLEKRQFVLHQVGRGDPAVFGTRFAMCYLRGPLTRVEVGRVNAMYEQDPLPGTSEEGAPSSFEGGTRVKAEDEAHLLDRPPSVAGASMLYLEPREAFSARMNGVFESGAAPPRADGRVVLAPALIARLHLQFDEDRVGFLHETALTRVFYPLEDRLPDHPLELELRTEDLQDEPLRNALFHPLPTWLDEAKEWKALSKRFVDDVYRTERAGMFVHRKLRLYGKGGESRSDFADRCRDLLESRMDEDLAELKGKYAKKLERIEDRIEKEEAKLQELQTVARSQQLEEIVNVGATLFSFFGGRSRSLTKAVSKRRQSARAGARVDRSEAELERLQADAEALEAELYEEAEKLEAGVDEALETIEERPVKLEKSDIRVEAFGVLWVPRNRRI